MVVQTCNLEVLRRWGQEDQGLKDILGYIMSLQPTWTTRDSEGMGAMSAQRDWKLRVHTAPPEDPALKLGGS